MKNILLVLSLLIFASSVRADISVIVHPSLADTLDGDTISRIFLGKDRAFPSGGQAVPINMAERSKETKEFNQKVLKKSDGQVKSYWSRLVFTGKGQPPREVENTKEMLNLISANPNMIGFVDSAEVNDSVKVVATF